MKQLATHVRFNGGHRIFSEGERPDSAFGLSYGVVRLYKLLPDEVVAFAQPGDFLAMPLADRFSFSADAISRQPPRRIPALELAAFKRQDIGHVQAMDAYPPYERPLCAKTQRSIMHVSRSTGAAY